MRITWPIVGLVNLVNVNLTGCGETSICSFYKLGSASCSMPSSFLSFTSFVGLIIQLISMIRGLYHPCPNPKAGCGQLSDRGDGVRNPGHWNDVARKIGRGARKTGGEGKKRHRISS